MSLTVSVIIPALNERHFITEAIESAWEAGAGEVIVVDGGSEDGTVEAAQKCSGRVISSPSGRAIQQNAGAAVATGQILLFQHADCRLGRDSLGQIQGALAQQPQVVAGAFRQQIDQAGLHYKLLASGNALRVRWLGLAYGDQGIFVRRNVFDQVGGFANVPLMEDVILMRQLRRFGATLLLPGPLQVSARRWQTYGVLRQTLRNWCLLTAFCCGVPPTTLQRFYTRHDRGPSGLRGP